MDYKRQKKYALRFLVWERGIKYSNQKPPTKMLKSDMVLALTTWDSATPEERVQMTINPPRPQNTPRPQNPPRPRVAVVTPQIQQTPTPPVHSNISDSTTEEKCLQCSICLVNKVCVVFGCTHVCCSFCSTKITTCHMCRAPIRSKNIFRI